MNEDVKNEELLYVVIPTTIYKKELKKYKKQPKKFEKNRKDCTNFDRKRH